MRLPGHWRIRGPDSSAVTAHGRMQNVVTLSLVHTSSVAQRAPISLGDRARGLMQDSSHLSCISFGLASAVMKTGLYSSSSSNASLRPAVIGRVTGTASVQQLHKCSGFSSLNNAMKHTLPGKAAICYASVSLKECAREGVLIGVSMALCLALGTASWSSTVSKAVSNQGDSLSINVFSVDMELAVLCTKWIPTMCTYQNAAFVWEFWTSRAISLQRELTS